MGAAGCSSLKVSDGWPGETVRGEGPIRLHCDFALAGEQRLLADLVARKTDMQRLLKIDLTDEPVDVYLFQDQNRFTRFARKEMPQFSDRRALFLQTDTELKVLAHCSATIGEDLRHEMTHGYLHGTFGWLPLWLDEGLAEYFERQRGAEDRHDGHIHHLASEFRSGRWQPNLQRLEEFENPADFGQTQYSEAWLWVHFLLQDSGKGASSLSEYLAELSVAATGQPQLSTRLRAELPALELDLLKHLKRLASDRKSSPAVTR